MKKLKILIVMCLSMTLFSACNREERNTEPLEDPWTKERTPVNFRLESQIGAAVITGDWRHDERGNIRVSLITSAIDISKVKVTAIDFKYPDSEFCPTASIKPGDFVDLSSGTCEFVVTAYNGDTRTYTVSYEQFKDPLEGCYSHDMIAGILDSGAPKSSMVVLGGWTDAVVLSTAMDKSWHWGEGYSTADEEDNVLSFMLTEADSETGQTFGTLVNTAGDDGKYANYVYDNKYDVNGKYRIFPAGSSRWSKDESGNITIYSKDDAEYENPLYVVSPLDAGKHTFAGKEVSVPNYAFMRDHNLQPEDEVVDDVNWPDTRWMVNNIRNTFWTVVKTSDEALPEHNNLF